jgi:uncharacterized protein (DUF433 family)
MPRSTVAAWAKGQGSFKRVLDLPNPDFLSFINLTEAFVLQAIRSRYKIKLEEVRIAIDYVQNELNVEHPLAFEQFKTDGVHLFVKTAIGHVSASGRGQTRMNEVLHDLERIEWQSERPVALFPMLRTKNYEQRLIKISPLVAFGKPVIAGTRVPTRILCERFFSGDSIERLAEDFALAPEVVQEAVRAESRPDAA